MPNLQSLTVAQLREVVDIKEQIEKLEGELESLLGEASAKPSGVRKKRRMSRAARAAIGAAQRARWAKLRGKTSAKGGAAKKKKRKVSAAVKAKLAAIARARWAKVKAAGKSKL